MDMLFLAVAAILILTLVEMIEDRKRKEFIIKNRRLILNAFIKKITR